jgi:protein TonB
MRATLVTTVYPTWQPDEMGMGRATAASVVLVGLIVGGLVVLADSMSHTPPPEQVTKIEFVQLPPDQPPLAQAPIPPAPPPPDVEQPPPPPLAIKPPDFTPPSRVAIPPPPPPKPVVRREVPRPVPPPPVRTAPRAAPTPPVATTTTAPPVAAPPPAAPVDTQSGIGPYQRGLHNIIESHVEVGPQIQALGISGTTYIEAVIAPNGQVLSARIARSSGNALIDKAALAAVQRGGFPAFRGRMPTTPINAVIPIEITPGGTD